jgi:hypothetical protein
MTAKEKATQLIKKFGKMEKYSASDTAAFDITLCKKCSLIAVDEILDTLSPFGGDDNARNYWNEVKKEIELL